MGTLGALLILSALAAAAGEDGARDTRPLLTRFSNMYGPCVVETAADYRYKMWSFGWATGFPHPGIPGCDAIPYARSKDLRNWEVYGKDGT